MDYEEEGQNEHDDDYDQGIIDDDFEIGHS